MTDDAKLLFMKNCKSSDPNFFPITFVAKVGNRSVKMKILGFDNDRYEFEVNGVPYD